MPIMIRAGFTITNPITQSRTIVLQSDAETNDMGWLLEVHCVPQAVPDIAEHLHTDWTERFTIVSGTAYYSLDGVRHTAQAGDSFVVAPRQRHIHPWNAGDAPLVYRQQNDFGRPSPAAVQDVLGVFATTAGLARLGKVDPNGRPKHPLQLAATLKTLNKHGGYDASIPLPVQQFLSATLGRLAEALGYRGVDPRYVQSPPR
jgi:mannose-6-phosphate isomerase-like protein (cupin superfamily)